MQSVETDQILTRAQQGDPAATEQLMARYRDRLRRMINVFLDPRLSARVDPSDVLQEVLASAATRLPRYLEERPVDFYPWLRAIVRDELIKLHRRHMVAKRRSIHFEKPFGTEISDASVHQLVDRLVSNESSPSQKASFEEIKSQVLVALGELPESDREILLMRCVEQLGVLEIAAIVGISESAVKSRLRRAIQKLGSKLRS